MNAVYLVQDIETIPETEIQHMWEEESKMLAEKGKPTDFPPTWAHKVACIGMLALDKDHKPIKGACAAGGLSGGKSEKEMLEKWNEAASGKLFKTAKPLKLVDWNGRKFDVPVMQTRCFRYGIQMPWYFGLLPDNKGGISTWSKEYRDRYGGNHLDVQELWTGKGSFVGPHLANLACLMGLPGKVGIDGSQVYGAWKEKRFEEIDNYCMQDVFETAFIFQRFKYQAGDIDLEKYRECAGALLAYIKELPEHKAFIDGVNEDALLVRDV